MTIPSLTKSSARYAAARFSSSRSVDWAIGSSLAARGAVDKPDKLADRRHPRRGQLVFAGEDTAHHRCLVGARRDKCNRAGAFQRWIGQRHARYERVEARLRYAGHPMLFFVECRFAGKQRG